MVVMIRQAQIVTVVAVCGLLYGCVKIVGPVFVNRSDSSAAVTISTTNAEYPGVWIRADVASGMEFLSLRSPPQPGEILSVKITYGNMDSTIIYKKEYLDEMFSKFGGANLAVFLISEDGVQLISWKEYSSIRKKPRL